MIHKNRFKIQTLLSRKPAYYKFIFISLSDLFEVQPSDVTTDILIDIGYIIILHHVCRQIPNPFPVISTTNCDQGTRVSRMKSIIGSFVSSHETKMTQSTQGVFQHLLLKLFDRSLDEKITITYNYRVSNMDGIAFKELQ